MTSRKLDKSLLGANRSSGKDALLCIDFGTAMSKAAATDGSGYRPILLPLGQIAKDRRTENKFAAQSSLFVDKQGVVHFGHEAVSRWARQRGHDIARLDSMKGWLSTGPLVELDREPVDDRFLPAGCALTKGEALTLMLAYVTDLACWGLTSARLSRHAKRRFTRPVWTGDRQHWCDAHMARYLGQAQLVADSLSGRWEGGIVLEEARELLDLARAEKIPDWFVEPRGVPEPIAAGHCRVERDYEHRYLALVIDVGAGTTDLAVFAGTQGYNSVGLTIATPLGETKSILMAGDFLDKVLREEIWDNLPASKRNDEIRLQAEGYARDWKEQLFEHGSVQPTFAGGVVASAIRRDDFLALPGVKLFTKSINDAVDGIFQSVSGLADQMAAAQSHPLTEITILASGGGAGLPMIKSLAKRRLGKHGLRMRDAGPAPEWFVSYHRDEVPVFHQMAVAIGGAFPKLPGPPSLRKSPKRNSL